MKTRGVDSVYSWVVALSCGLLYLMITLPAKLGSLLFVDMIGRYDTNRKHASLPFALAYLIRSVSSPFGGYFGDMFGLQQVTMFGCILCSVGVGLCFFSEEIISIDIFLGLIYGCGLGWSSCLVPEIVNQHFLKHRAKGYSLVLGLSGVLNLITPPILEMILVEYGVSGTFLIMSAVILNSVPAAMILVKPDEKTTITNDSLTVKTLNQASSLNRQKSPIEINIQESTITDKFNSYQDQPSISLAENNVKLDFKRNVNKVKREDKLDSTENKDNANEAKIDLIESNENKIQIITHTFEKKRDSRSISILWSPLFLLITFMQSSHFYVMYISWTITVDLVRDKDIAHHLEVYFVMALALFDTVGRSALGFVTDGGYMAIVYFNALCFGVMGFSCILLAWVSGFAMTMTAICIFAFICGVNLNVLPGIVTKFIEKEKRTMAMASRLILCAPMSFTMSPLIGYFRGDMGSYNGLLYIMATLCISCSVLLLLLNRWKNKQ